MPGTVLAVDVIPPSTDPGDQLRGMFTTWRVSLLTPHGWEYVGGWTTDDAEAKAHELARRIIDMAAPDQDIRYLDPIECS